MKPRLIIHSYRMTCKLSVWTLGCSCFVLQSEREREVGAEMAVSASQAGDKNAANCNHRAEVIFTINVQIWGVPPSSATTTFSSSHQLSLPSLSRKETGGKLVCKDGYYNLFSQSVFSSRGQERQQDKACPFSLVTKCTLLSFPSPHFNSHPKLNQP